MEKNVNPRIAKFPANLRPIFYVGATLAVAPNLFAQDLHRFVEKCRILHPNIYLKMGMKKPPCFHRVAFIHCSVSPNWYPKRTVAMLEMMNRAISP